MKCDHPGCKKDAYGSVTVDHCQLWFCSNHMTVVMGQLTKERR